MSFEGRKLNKCLRCGYTWFTRKPCRSKVCARCRTPYWDTPRKRSNINSRLKALKESLNN